MIRQGSDNNIDDDIPQPKVVKKEEGKREHVGFTQTHFNDRELRQEIETAIQREPEIPEESKHVQVLIKDGGVILKGTVHSEHEKFMIGGKATAFVGFGKVSNELEVKE